MDQALYRSNPYQYGNDLFSAGIGSRQFFNAIRQELPSVFDRKTASKAIGGLMSAKTLSNLDGCRQGPPTRVRIGHRVGYERESFMLWLQDKIKSW